VYQGCTQGCTGCAPPGTLFLTQLRRLRKKAPLAAVSRRSARKVRKRSSPFPSLLSSFAPFPRNQLETPGKTSRRLLETSLFVFSRLFYFSAFLRFDLVLAWFWPGFRPVCSKRLFSRSCSKRLFSQNCSKSPVKPLVNSLQISDSRFQISVYRFGHVSTPCPALPLSCPCSCTLLPDSRFQIP